MSDNEFYIYQLKDPRTDNPFYIGKGKNNRMYQHLAEARGCRDKWVNKIKCQIINNIELAGRDVIFEKIKDKLTEEEAYTLEITLIGEHGKMIDGTGILSNIADGGEGGSSQGRPVQKYTVSGALVASYKSLDAAAKDTKIHKSTICAALNGRSVLAGGHRWGYDGELPNLASHKSCTPIVCYTIDGSFLHTYESIKAASLATSVVYTAIIDCAKGSGNMRTAGGFRWAYPNEKLLPLPEGFKYRPKSRKLHSVDSAGNTVRVFLSVKEAVDNTTATPTGISDCCAGRKRCSGGVGWKWVG